jgi:hypothetical protein
MNGAKMLGRFSIASIAALLTFFAAIAQTPQAPAQLLNIGGNTGGEPGGGGSSDTTPNAFSFTDQTNVSLSSTITSAAVAITGINTSINCTATGGTVDVGADGDFQSSRTVTNGQDIRARHTSSGSNSTATNTPVDCGGVSDTFTSTTLAASGGDRYTCADAIVGTSGVECPTAPTTTSEVTGVTTATFAGHINDSGDDGKHLHLTAGNYGNFTWGRNNQKITAEPGVIFGDVTFSGDNLELVCETERACSMGEPVVANTSNHLLIDGWAIDATNDSADELVVHGGTHFSLINSSLVMYRWCTYSNYNSHMVWGNNFLRTLGTATGCVRLMSVTNSAFSDNWFQVDGSSSNNYRVHAVDAPGGNNWLMRNLSYERGLTTDASAGGGYNALGSQHMVGNCLYYTGGFMFIGTGSGTSRPSFGRVRDNVAHGAGMVWPTSSNYQSGSDIANNTSTSYSTPPTFDYDGDACS